MGGPKFDVSTDKGLAGFNGFMGSKSYVEGWQFSNSDTEYFAKFQESPDGSKHPHAYRWYIHIAALHGVRGISVSRPPKQETKNNAQTTTTADDDDFDVFGDEDDATPKQTSKETPEEEAGGGDDDDFDVFGDEDKETEEEPKESRKDMLARLKKEAEERTAKKEAKQRTLVALEIKPWSTEQDLMELWTKITATIIQDGVKWGEACHLADVAFGIKKICTTFVMGVNNSSDDIVEAIQSLEDEVQSVEVISMNVL